MVFSLAGVKTLRRRVAELIARGRTMAALDATHLDWVLEAYERLAAIREHSHFVELLDTIVDHIALDEDDDGKRAELFRALYELLMNKPLEKPPSPRVAHVRLVKPPPGD